MMGLLTFFLGIVAATGSYGIQNFVLKPVQDYKKFRAHVGYQLTYYAHIITSPGSSPPLATEASSVIRGLGCDLEKTYSLVPFRSVFIESYQIPSKQTIIDANVQIILISNSLHSIKHADNNYAALEKIFTFLDIYELKPRFNQKK